MEENYTIEISSNILVSENKPNTIMINEYVLTIINKHNLTCVYRRSFLDNNLEMITIDLPVNIDTKKLMDIMNNIKDNKQFIRKEWDIINFSKCIAIDFSYDDYTYDIPIESDIGKQIIEITKIDKYLKYSNKEILNFINI